MSQETNSAVYLLAQKQRRWRCAALVTWCQVNDCLHLWILREVSVCTDWASARKETERGERLCKNKTKKKNRQEGPRRKQKRIKPGCRERCLWYYPELKGAASLYPSLRKNPVFTCLLPALSFFGAGAWGREAFQVKAQPCSSPPPRVCFFVTRANAAKIHCEETGSWFGAPVWSPTLCRSANKFRRKNPFKWLGSHRACSFRRFHGIMERKLRAACSGDEGFWKAGGRSGT